MKVIDLLNKIANGEEVPKKIKFDGDIYIYDKECEDYNNSNNFGLFESIKTNMILNDEVEIIEEEEKIPEKLGLIKYSEDQATLLIHHKVDEIIDYLHFLKSKGE